MAARFVGVHEDSDIAHAAALAEAAGRRWTKAPGFQFRAAGIEGLADQAFGPGAIA